MAHEDSISEPVNKKLMVFYKPAGEGRKLNNTVTFSYVKTRKFT